MIPFYYKLREFIAEKTAAEVPFAVTEIEVGESFFASVRKGKRRIGSASKVTIFGLPKRGDKVGNARVLNGLIDRIYADNFRFLAGIISSMLMLRLLLFYVHSDYFA